MLPNFDIDTNSVSDAKASETSDVTIFRPCVEHMLNGMAYCRMLYKDGQPSDFIYLYANPAHEQLTGLKHVIGKPVSEVIPRLRETDLQLFDIYSRVAMGGEPEKIEIFVEALVMWFSISVYSPKPDHFVSIFDVITERKQTEAALRESERELRSLAEAMPQIVWVTRPDGWSTYFNQQWVEYTGLTLEESYGHGWIKPFHPDDQQHAWDAWQHATHVSDTYSLECRLRRAGGTYRWWLIRGVPVRNESGAIIKWFGTCTDIEDIEQAEADLRYRESQLRFITNHVSILIAHCDQEKHYKFVNQPYADFFCLQPSDFIDKHPLEILGEESYLQANPYMDAALSGQTTGYELELTKTPHGSSVVSVKYIPEFDVSGRTIGFVATISDITERKHAEHQLRIAATAFESHEGIIITDANATILNVNRSFSWITGYAAEEVIGKNPRIISSGRHDKVFYEAMWEHLNKEGK